MTDPTTTLTPESTSKYVEADGVKIHLHEAGSGPLLLLVHGGAPGAYGWGNFGQNMAAFAEHFRTVIVDLPGYGGSELPPEDGGEGRYASYARIFAALIRELGAEKAHVLGLATGGAAAIALALDHPEVVDRLVLVSSAGGQPLFTPSPSEGQKIIRSYYGGKGPSRDKMVKYLEMMLFDQELVTDELVEERYQASLVGRTRDIGSPEPLWTRMHEIAASTLVIWGRDNRVQGYDNALFMLQRIPDVEVHLFGKTGLWVPFERAARFEALVKDFLG